MSAVLTSELTNDKMGNPVSIEFDGSAWSVRCDGTQVSGFGGDIDAAWRNYYTLHKLRFWGAPMPQNKLK